MTTCTCDTDGCSNAGVGIDLDLDWTDDDGASHHVDHVYCGVCGEPITDLTPAGGDQ